MSWFLRFAMVKFTVISAFGMMLACHAAQQTEKRNTQVLFLCEHGNVKSLMAASYFNRLAQDRGLPYRAVARGTTPSSAAVPPVIITRLRNDGHDVSSFHPSKISASDITQSARVITIGVDLPADALSFVGTNLEQWNDVPAATTDFLAASKSLKEHVAELLERLSKEH